MQMQSQPEAVATVQAEQAPEEMILLRSDIIPVKEKARKNPINNRTKLRIEKDEDFSVR